MRKLQLFSMLLSLTMLFLACSDHSAQKIAPYNPTTLKQLHSGFFDEEIIPEINTTDKKEITIVTTGHLYPLLKHPLVYTAMIDSIMSQKPDYVFLLGDLAYNNTEEEWDTVLARFDQIGCKVYYAPGNHDVNYHYERWEGSREHQFEAEMRYINKVGYRYKLMKDNIANYVFINPNDSINRVLSFLNTIKPELDTTKMMVMLSSPCLWHNTNQDPDYHQSWVYKAFTRDEILPEIENFDYLIHGDWNEQFHRGFYPKKHGQFQVMSVGNRKPGDTFFITRLDISLDTIISSSIPIHIPKDNAWWK